MNSEPRREQESEKREQGMKRILYNLEVWKQYEKYCILDLKTEKTDIKASEMGYKLKHNDQTFKV